jgi:hypothetical protein
MFGKKRLWMLENKAAMIIEPKLSFHRLPKRSKVQ